MNEHVGIGINIYVSIGINLHVSIRMHVHVSIGMTLYVGIRINLDLTMDMRDGLIGMDIPGCLASGHTGWEHFSSIGSLDPMNQA